MLQNNEKLDDQAKVKKFKQWILSVFPEFQKEVRANFFQTEFGKDRFDPGQDTEDDLLFQE